MRPFESAGGHSRRYTYDANGNRLSHSDAAGTTSYHYEAGTNGCRP